MPWATIAIGGATLLSGALGANAASDAADQQAAASGRAIDEQRHEFDTTQQNNAPFLQTGTAANARLRTLLGLDDGGDPNTSPLLRKFGQADLNADPVYQNGLQFGADQGRDAINARAIQAGGYDSGATLKALTRFGTDYGSTKANESYNRFTNDQSNTYNKLAGVSGTGQVASNQIAAAGSNMANNVSASLEGAGNARAAGIVGGANAWGGAMTGAVNSVNNYQSNQQLMALLGKRGAGGNGYGGSPYGANSSDYGYYDS